jgi:hypothetical protein
MFSRIATCSAASGPRKAAQLNRRIGAVTAVALCWLTACSQAPPSPFAGRDPSNPQAAVPPVAYRSTVAPYVSRRPVEPRPWGEQNERVAPAEKP